MYNAFQIKSVNLTFILPLEQIITKHLQKYCNISEVIPSFFKNFNDQGIEQKCDLY
jgi:hypothetical protein